MCNGTLSAFFQQQQNGLGQPVGEQYEFLWTCRMTQNSSVKSCVWLYGPMVCLEWSHMTSTNQSQCDVKFVTDSSSSSRNGTALV